MIPQTKKRVDLISEAVRDVCMPPPLQVESVVDPPFFHVDTECYSCSLCHLLRMRLVAVELVDYQLKLTVVVDHLRMLRVDVSIPMGFTHQSKHELTFFVAMHSHGKGVVGFVGDWLLSNELNRLIRTIFCDSSVSVDRIVILVEGVLVDDKVVQSLCVSMLWNSGSYLFDDLVMLYSVLTNQLLVLETSFGLLLLFFLFYRGKDSWRVVAKPADSHFFHNLN